MAHKRVSFPRWSSLTEEQQLVIQNLLKTVANLESDIEAVNEIILGNPTENQIPPSDDYQVVDSSGTLNSDVEDIQEFIKIRFRRRMQEKPIVPICVLCRSLGKTDGYCTGC